jgi:hypothetical protein
MSSAITAVVVGGAISANQQSKAASAQKKAAKQAQDASAAAMAGNAEWTQRGSDAANRLQMMMGLNGGENDTYESLSAKHRDEFVTYVQGKKKKRGGLAGVLGMKKGGKVTAVFGAAEQAKLDAFVNNKLAQNKATREDPLYGSLMKRFSNDDFVKDPGYDWRMQEGQRGVESSAAARGGLFSGAAGKEMNRYTQGFASNEFGLANDRFTRGQDSDYNKLAGIAGQGFEAQRRNTESVQQNNADIYGLANAKADRAIAQGQQITNALNTGANYWASSKAMEAANKRQDRIDDYNMRNGFRAG